MSARYIRRSPTILRGPHAHRCRRRLSRLDFAFSRCTWVSFRGARRCTNYGDNPTAKRGETMTKRRAHDLLSRPVEDAIRKSVPAIRRGASAGGDDRDKPGHDGIGAPGRSKRQRRPEIILPCVQYVANLCCQFGEREWLRDQTISCVKTAMMHDRISGIAAREQHLQISPSPPRFVRQLTTIHPTWQSNISEKQFDLSMRSRIRRAWEPSCASSTR